LKSSGGILDLPNELICLIAGDLARVDFDHLSSVCKKLKDTLENYAVEHHHIMSTSSIQALVGATRDAHGPRISTVGILAAYSNQDRSAYPGRDSSFWQTQAFESLLAQAFQNICARQGFLAVALYNGPKGWSGHQDPCGLEKLPNIKCILNVLPHVLTAAIRARCSIRNLSIDVSQIDTAFVDSSFPPQLRAQLQDHFALCTIRSVKLRFEDCRNGIKRLYNIDYECSKDSLYLEGINLCGARDGVQHDIGWLLSLFCSRKIKTLVLERCHIIDPRFMSYVLKQCGKELTQLRLFSSTVSPGPNKLQRTMDWSHLLDLVCRHSHPEEVIVQDCLYLDKFRCQKEIGVACPNIHSQGTSQEVIAKLRAWSCHLNHVFE
jgi:hypothetical protein